MSTLQAYRPRTIPPALLAGSSDRDESRLSRVAAYREILLWWAGSRLLIGGIVLAVSALGSRAGLFRGTMLRHPLSVLTSWDGQWYSTIAQHGYLYVPGQESNPAFFPLFPAMLRVLSLLGVDTRIAAVAIANVALPVALLALYELGRELIAEPLARRASILAAIFPVGVVFSMAYPQSLVLAAVALAGTSALRGRWLATAFFLGVGTLARPECLFVAVPIAVVAFRRRDEMSTIERGTAVGALLAAPAALLSYVLYLGWTLHDPLAWSHAQHAWGRSFQIDGLVTLVQKLPASLGHNPWLARDAIAVVVYAGLLAAAARIGVPRPWILAAVLVIALPLLSGSVQSEARFGLLAPPIYWGLAGVSVTPRREAIVRVMCLCLLCAATVTIPQVFP
jgi:hypothetical protein